MWGERIDVTGSGIGPRQFGIVQGVSIDVDFTDKPLFGQEQWPLAIGRGQGKITGKVESAQLNMLLYADIFFGLTSTVGQFGVSQSEAGVVPASPAYTITPSNAATFLDDLGVAYNTATGNRFNRVTAPSGPGEYSVNFGSGLYTFDAADAGATVVISYAYQITGTGRELDLVSQLQGFTPAWKGTFYQKISPNAPGQGGSLQGFAVRLNACVSSKLSLVTKQQDWEIPGFDFEAFADATGSIGTISMVAQ